MKTYIVAAVRTAVGSYGGGLKDVSAPSLASIVVKEALNRAGVKPESVDELIFGQVLSAGIGQNLARQAAIGAGLPTTATAFTVNKVCGSGLKTVAMASQAIRAGDAQCIVSGGAESMSQAPYISNNMRWGARMGDVSMIDYMIHDGLFDIFNGYHMGITAENVAEKYGITRQMQDELALASQTKAAKAIETGRFKDEIVPVEVKVKKETKLFDTDEYVRPGTTMEGLTKLRPAFKKDGTVTAGNASGINDGAAALVVCSEEFVKANNLKPLACIVSSGSVGCDPSVMGIGPIESVRQALKKANMQVSDLELIEANEAFAAQAYAVNNELGLNPEIVNVNGGAIAIGHPIGASGARILTTLLYEMKKRDVKVGLATLCIGGGMGEALIVRRDELCQ